MGGAGDPLPTRSRDDPPTGTAASNVAKRPPPLARTVAPVPSGESPDGTGESPVLPANPFFKHALSMGGRTLIMVEGNNIEHRTLNFERRSSGSPLGRTFGVRCSMLDVRCSSYS